MDPMGERGRQGAAPLGGRSPDLLEAIDKALTYFRPKQPDEEPASLPWRMEQVEAILRAAIAKARGEQ